MAKNKLLTEDELKEELTRLLSEIAYRADLYMTLTRTHKKELVAMGGGFDLIFYGRSRFENIFNDNKVTFFMGFESPDSAKAILKALIAGVSNSGGEDFEGTIEELLR